MYQYTLRSHKSWHKNNTTYIFAKVETGIILIYEC